jgi:hypothetical protein
MRTPVGIPSIVEANVPGLTPSIDLEALPPLGGILVGGSHTSPPVTGSASPLDLNVPESLELSPAEGSLAASEHLVLAGDPVDGIPGGGGDDATPNGMGAEATIAAAAHDVPPVEDSTAASNQAPADRTELTGDAASSHQRPDRDTSELIALDATARATDEILVVPSEVIDEETKRSLRLEFSLNGDETPDAWVEAALAAPDDLSLDRFLTPLGVPAIQEDATSSSSDDLAPAVGERVDGDAHGGATLGGAAPEGAADVAEAEARGLRSRGAVGRGAGRVSPAHDAGALNAERVALAAESDGAHEARSEGITSLSVHDDAPASGDRTGTARRRHETTRTARGARGARGARAHGRTGARLSLTEASDSAPPPLSYVAGEQRDPATEQGGERPAHAHDVTATRRAGSDVARPMRARACRGADDLSAAASGEPSHAGRRCGARSDRHRRCGGGRRATVVAEELERVDGEAQRDVEAST